MLHTRYNLLYYSTQHEVVLYYILFGCPDYLIFEPGMGYFFHSRFFQTSFVQWLFSFAQNLQTLVTILIYKNVFGPLGYSASAYDWLAPKGTVKFRK